VGLANRIIDAIGDEGYEALLKLKQKNDKEMKTIPKDEMTTDDRGDPQSKRFIVRSKLVNQGVELLKDKKGDSIARTMVNDFFDRDQPDLDQLSAMEDKIKALSAEFEEEPSTDDQDRRYGRTSTKVTHKDGGVKKITSNQGSLGT
jgi:hypothetical protein